MKVIITIEMKISCQTLTEAVEMLTSFINTSHNHNRIIKNFLDAPLLLR